MKRLIENTVRRELVTAWRLAGSPTRRLALVGKGDHARRQPVALLIGNDLGLFSFHDGHDGIGSSQVDADDFFTLSHCARSFLRFFAFILTAGLEQ